VWCGCIDDLLARVGRHVARPESRIRLESMLLALLSREGPKNCWTLAEQAGEARPWGMQHLLARAVWDTDAVAGELRDFAVEHLGAADAILVVDETGDLKKGRHTVGVQRQYTGTAGRIENAQVGVYLGYATRRGHALIDRELYLPRSWTEDPDRCAAAGVPAGVGFATKPALAQALIERALDAGVPAGWVTADEVYGADPRLASALETRGVGYVLAIAAHRRCRSMPPARAPPHSSPPTCRGGPGRFARPAPARTARGGMPGPGSSCTGALRRRPAGPSRASSRSSPRREPGRCWCAATSAPGSWRSTAATPRPRPLWPS
jgi:SRSO17 transposase